MTLRASVLAALSERYEVGAEIGQGGMAVVYRARDKRHDSDVAIKMLRQELIAAMGGERFTREIQVTAQLQHPNILPLLDSGIADGVPYYVMPLVDGASLESALERSGPLPIKDAVRYVAEVADGLAYAHTKALIHRDIKPANILLSHGHALLADFGIARVIETAGTAALTQTGIALGTATYMSPEQAAGERVDARADIYALGCVLYELLTGSPPFAGSSQRAIMARHAVDAVPSIRTVRDEVSKALEAVITRAMCKTPADRFQSAEEFRTALLEAASSTTPGVVAEQGSVRGSRGLMAVAGVLVAVIAIASIVLVKRPPAATALNSNRVMVFPLMLPDLWVGSKTAGEDAATLIGSAMDGAGKMRWIDGWGLLPAARRDSAGAISNAFADSLARANDSRYIITGKVVLLKAQNPAARGSDDSVSVVLSLRDLAKTEPATLWEGRSLASEPWRAGLGAVTMMLPRLIPSGDLSVLRDWSDRSPKAIGFFLTGEAAMRRVHATEALEQFKSAVAVDSTFGYAALRGAQVAIYAHERGEAAQLLKVAVPHARSSRERVFAAGLAAFLNGQADVSVALLDSALRIDPEMSVAWMQLSETYMHLLPAAGSTDSLAGIALDHAIALDTGGTHLLFHEIELAARAGVALRADSLAKRFLAVAPDTMQRDEVKLIADCVNKRWTHKSLIDAALHTPQPLSIASKLLGLSQAQCMRDGYSALLQNDTSAQPEAGPRRFYALMGLQQVLLSEGKTDSAAAEIDRFQARWKEGNSLYLSGAPVVPAFAAAARRIAAEDSVKFGVNYHGFPYSSRLWQLGVWAVMDGKTETGKAVAADLRARAAKSGLKSDSAMFESLDAHLAIARGDTAAAIAGLRALLLRSVTIGEVSYFDYASFGLQRLLLGKLLVARKQFSEARGVLEVLDSAQPAGFPLYAPLALKWRADAAAAMGDAVVADRLRKRSARLPSS